MTLRILLLPGDGVGAEVTRAAVGVLEAVARKFGHRLALSEGLIGGVAIHKTGSPLPEDTVNKALAGDAALLGAVGWPGLDEDSPLWRRVVTEVAGEFPEVALDHLLVDNCAMQLVLNPRRFDVVLTENMFGDILSDEAAVLAGSIGMLPSASLGESKGLYEPV